MNVSIIDNFYPRQDEIENLLTSDDFGWFISKDSVDPKDVPDLPNVRESWFFTHVLKHGDLINSSFYVKLNDLSEYTNMRDKSIFRIRANLSVPQPGNEKDHMLPPHKDELDENYYSLLYYVNDSDGDTLFFKDDFELIERVSPKKGRCVIFNSSIYHCGQLPIKSDKRIVINYMLK